MASTIRQLHSHKNDDYDLEDVPASTNSEVAESLSIFDELAAATAGNARAGAGLRSSSSLSSVGSTSSGSKLAHRRTVSRAHSISLLSAGLQRATRAEGDDEISAVVAADVQEVTIVSADSSVSVVPPPELLPGLDVHTEQVVMNDTNAVAPEQGADTHKDGDNNSNNIFALKSSLPRAESDERISPTTIRPTPPTLHPHHHHHHHHHRRTGSVASSTRPSLAVLQSQKYPAINSNNNDGLHEKYHSEQDLLTLRQRRRLSEPFGPDGLGGNPLQIKTTGRPGSIYSIRRSYRVDLDSSAADALLQPALRSGGLMTAKSLGRFPEALMLATPTSTSSPNTAAGQRIGSSSSTSINNRSAEFVNDAKLTAERRKRMMEAWRVGVVAAAVTQQQSIHSIVAFDEKQAEMDSISIHSKSSRFRGGSKSSSRLDVKGKGRAAGGTVSNESFLVATTAAAVGSTGSTSSISSLQATSSLMDLNSPKTPKATLLGQIARSTSNTSVVSSSAPPTRSVSATATIATTASSSSVEMMAMKKEDIASTITTDEAAMADIASSIQEAFENDFMSSSQVQEVTTTIPTTESASLSIAPTNIAKPSKASGTDSPLDRKSKRKSRTTTKKEEDKKKKRRQSSSTKRLFNRPLSTPVISRSPAMVTNRNSPLGASRVRSSPVTFGRDQQQQQQQQRRFASTSTTVSDMFLNSNNINNRHSVLSNNGGAAATATQSHHSPYQLLHTLAAELLERLSRSDTRELNRRLKRTFDIHALSQMSNSVIENVLTDVTNLGERFRWVEAQVADPVNDLMVNDGGGHDTDHMEQDEVGSGSESHDQSDDGEGSARSRSRSRSASSSSLSGSSFSESEAQSSGSEMSEDEDLDDDEPLWGFSVDEFFPLAHLVQEMLSEIGKLRIMVNELQLSYVQKVEQDRIRAEQDFLKGQDLDDDEEEGSVDEGDFSDEDHEYRDSDEKFGAGTRRRRRQRNRSSRTGLATNGSDFYDGYSSQEYEEVSEYQQHLHEQQKQEQQHRITRAQQLYREQQQQRRLSSNLRIEDGHSSISSARRGILNTLGDIQEVDEKYNTSAQAAAIAAAAAAKKPERSRILGAASTGVSGFLNKVFGGNSSSAAAAAAGANQQQQGPNAGKTAFGSGEAGVRDDATPTNSTTTKRPMSSMEALKTLREMDRAAKTAAAAAAAASTIAEVGVPPASSSSSSTTSGNVPQPPTTTPKMTASSALATALAHHPPSSSGIAAAGGSSMKSSPSFFATLSGRVNNHPPLSIQTSNTSNGGVANSESSSGARNINWKASPLSSNNKTSTTSPLSASSIARSMPNHPFSFLSRSSLGSGGTTNHQESGQVQPLSTSISTTTLSFMERHAKENGKKMKDLSDDDDEESKELRRRRLRSRGGDDDEEVLRTGSEDDGKDDDLYDNDEEKESDNDDDDDDQYDEHDDAVAELGHGNRNHHPYMSGHNINHTNNNNNTFNYNNGNTITPSTSRPSNLSRLSSPAPSRSLATVALSVDTTGNNNNNNDDYQPLISQGGKSPAAVALRERVSTAGTSSSSSSSFSSSSLMYQHHHQFVANQSGKQQQQQQQQQQLRNSGASSGHSVPASPVTRSTNSGFANSTVSVSIGGLMKGITEEKHSAASSLRGSGSGGSKRSSGAGGVNGHELVDDDLMDPSLLHTGMSPAAAGGGIGHPSVLTTKSLGRGSGKNPGMAYLKTTLMSATSMTNEQQRQPLPPPPSSSISSRPAIPSFMMNHNNNGSGNNKEDSASTSSLASSKKSMEIGSDGAGATTIVGGTTTTTSTAVKSSPSLMLLHPQSATTSTTNHFTTSPGPAPSASGSMTNLPLLMSRSPKAAVSTFGGTTASMTSPTTTTSTTASATPPVSTTATTTTSTSGGSSPSLSRGNAGISTAVAYIVAVPEHQSQDGSMVDESGRKIRGPKKRAVFDRDMIKASQKRILSTAASGHVLVGTSTALNTTPPVLSSGSLFSKSKQNLLSTSTTTATMTTTTTRGERSNSHVSGTGSQHHDGEAIDADTMATGSGTQYRRLHEGHLGKEGKSRRGRSLSVDSVQSIEPLKTSEVMDLWKVGAGVSRDLWHGIKEWRSGSSHSHSNGANNGGLEK